MSDVDVLWLLASWTLVVPSEWANCQTDASSDSLVHLWAFVNEEVSDLSALLSVLFAFFSLGEFGEGLGLWLHAPVPLVLPSLWALDGALATSLVLPSSWAFLVHEGGGDSGAVTSSVDFLASVHSWLEVKVALVNLGLELLSKACVEQDQRVHVLDS